MEILDGKSTAQKIVNKIASGISSHIVGIGRAPRLDMILVGDDFASSKYVGMKEKRAKEAGIDSVIHRLPVDVSQKDLLLKIEELNTYDGVDGYMIQLPLPGHLDTKDVLLAIDPKKDVDGLSPNSLGKLFVQADGAMAAATPKGIMMLLDEYNIDLTGKEVVVVGRSSVIGLPMSALLIAKDATVTVAHSKTKDLKRVCKRADIIISGAGVAGLITDEYVKEGTIVVDAGINMGKDGKLCGDVDRDSVKDKVKYLSPVPGGVGPMTIAALLWNCYQAWVKKLD